MLFIHREEVYAPDDADIKGLAELIIAKQRAGQTGVVNLVWQPWKQKFASRADHEVMT